jgi:hypothetical protein
MQQLDKFHGVGAFALALVATLVLAAWLTPRHWWRRPNARALAVLVAGTWGIGSLVLWLVHAVPAPVAASANMVPAPRVAVAAPQPAILSDPAPASAGRPFRVHRDLNLRAGAGTDTARIAIVRSGATVTPTGLRHGDWWQVRAHLAGGDVTGWTSSLWLRLPGEGGAQAAQAAAATNG